MIDALVLDASAALAWCFPDEATAATRELQVTLERVPAIVPWYYASIIAGVLRWVAGSRAAATLL